MYRKMLFHINACITGVCIGIFALMVAVVFLQVILRYFFQYGMPWAEELARYLQIWLTFLGACIAFYKLSHVSIAFFVDKLPTTLRLTSNLVVQSVTILFLVYLAYKGFSIAKFGWTMRSVGLGVPMTTIYLAIPCSSVLMILNIVENINTILRDRKQAKA